MTLSQTLPLVYMLIVRFLTVRCLHIVHFFFFSSGSSKTSFTSTFSGSSLLEAESSATGNLNTNSTSIFF